MKQYLRYGFIPESGKSKHIRYGFEEVGVSTLMPLNQLGKSLWSVDMIMTMTAGGCLDIENLIICEGEKVGNGSDGEDLISNATFVRMATKEERWQVVNDLENAALKLGFKKIENLYTLLKSESN